MINSTDAEKAFDKLQQPFLIKTHIKLGTEWNFPSLIWSICEKPRAHIILPSERLNSFSLRVETGRVSVLITLH